MIANVLLLLVIIGCIAFVGCVAWAEIEMREQIERDRQLQQHRERCQRLVRAHQAALRADRVRIQAEMDRRLDAYFRDPARQSRR